MQLTLRVAQPTDSALYFDWANDPVTRHQSFRTEPIAWADHTGWFTRKLLDPKALLLVFEAVPATPVGQVRFEATDNEVIIGLSIDRAFRGQGLAPTLISRAVAFYTDQPDRPDLPIHAYIRPDNTASVRSFERAGFVFSHESDKFGVWSVVYSFTPSVA